MTRTASSGQGMAARTGGDLRPPQRLPLLALGFVSLFLGLAAGLVRLGWPLPLPRADFVLLHGPLMASGFFGTLISLERAVALGRLWAYSAPLFTAAGAAALIAGAPLSAGGALMALGSLGLLLASFAVYRRQKAVFTATLLLGALAWGIGNLFWLAGSPVSQVVPWWAGFLVLTIAGERLELSRFLPPSVAAQRFFAAVLTILLLALVVVGVYPGWGRPLLAVALLALTAWLTRYDIARRTIQSQGLTRFIAVALLSGYLWLAVGAVIGLLSDGMFAAGPSYDATLHAVFLGFVFSMVFGHAPIILPAVTGFAIHYHPVFYLHLAILHASLALRLVGDLGGWADLRSAGGMMNALALIVFVLNTVGGLWRGRGNRG